MKDNSFEKTERAKHRKKQMKNTKIPKPDFIKIKTVRKRFSKTSYLRKSETNRLKDLCTTIRLIRKKS